MEMAAREVGMMALSMLPQNKKADSPKKVREVGNVRDRSPDPWKAKAPINCREVGRSKLNRLGVTSNESS